MTKWINLLAFLALISVSLCVPQNVMVNYPGGHPEGLEWSQDLGFLISSAALGTVHKVDDNGNKVPFVQSPTLVNSLGLQIDTKLNRLLITNTNGAAIGGTATGFLAGLVAADLGTGQIIMSVDLSTIGGQKPHFANDLAVDKDGNVYLTDSLQPQIWKVTLTGDGTVFATSDNFNGPFGLNGIDYHPDGYLITGNQGTGKLYKIMLNDPTQITEVKTDIPTPGLDGLIFRPNGGNLIAVASTAQTVMEIASTDNWATGTVIAKGVSQYGTPSTAALRDGNIYVLHAHFDTNPDNYEIELITMNPTGNQPPVTNTNTGTQVTDTAVTGVVSTATDTNPATDTTVTNTATQTGTQTGSQTGTQTGTDTTVDTNATETQTATQTATQSGTVITPDNTTDTATKSTQTQTATNTKTNTATNTKTQTSNPTSSMGSTSATSGTTLVNTQNTVMNAGIKSGFSAIIVACFVVALAFWN